MTTSRAQYVISCANAFASAMTGSLSLENLKNFADNAEGTAHEKSRDYTHGLHGNEMALTTHADHMRRIGAKIVLLRDGLVPALHIDRDSPTLYTQAVSEMAFIRAEFEAMDCGFQ